MTCDRCMAGPEPELGSTYAQAYFPSKGTSQSKRQHVGGKRIALWSAAQARGPEA